MPAVERSDGFPDGRDFFLPLIALAAIMAVSLAVAHLTAVPADADHVVKRSVLEDPTGQLAIDEVEDMPFAPMAEVLAASYTHSAHWVRLRVRPSAKGRSLVLRIRPTFLDTVTLFETDPDGAGWRSRVTGDMVPFGEREAAAAALALEIRPEEPDT